MASERPKRSRKIVNYGDHLHWVEESQLHKALLRSLNDKGSPQKQQHQQEVEDQTGRSSKPRKVKPSWQLNPDLDSSSSDDNDGVDSDSSEDSSEPVEAGCELRLTRLQTKLLAAAGMLDPETEPTGTSKTDDDQVFSRQTTLKQDLKNRNGESPDFKFSDAEEAASLFRPRAQRKFASNASPPSSRSDSPVKMHKQKVHKGSPAKRQTRVKEKQSTCERAVRASTSSTSDLTELSGLDKENHRKRRSEALSKNASKNYRASSLFNSVPKTDTFLDYLCFRNTSVKIELKDCMKNN